MQKIIRSNQPNVVHEGRLPRQVQLSRHKRVTPPRLSRSVNGLPLNSTQYWVKTINYQLDETGVNIRRNPQGQPVLETTWTYTRGLWRPGCTCVDLRDPFL
ncbi:hypothetical protein DID73_00280 [Candidatus Marinamargulisbacteria bacterium SCGC AG-343-K17]|nr:hypothetical protein DID73_00280 [Candidatus Marinamargulisbacteria bacterium SCGC AG-343-K17]